MKQTKPNTARHLALLMVVITIMGAALTRRPVPGDVVTILSPTQLNGGTGFQFRTESGFEYLVTNDHICEHADHKGQMYALAPDGGVHATKIIYRSPNTDICLMEAVEGLKPFYLASGLTLGEEVRAVGHPGLRALIETSGTALKRDIIDVAVGPVDAEHLCNLPKNKIGDSFWFGPTCYQHLSSVASDVHIEGGSSGSPALDSSGRVVGVFYAMDRQYSYFIPIEDLKGALDSAAHR